MNKKLIALAVGAAIAAPMSAQAGATLYGHLAADLSSESVDTVGGPTGTDGHLLQGGGGRFEDGVGVDDNKRGRLGVKGNYDLGGGLKAIYRFEWQVDTTEADVGDGTRNAFVGLKGSFGTIKIGSLKTPYKYMGGVKYDPFVTTELEARRYGGMTTTKFGSNSFFARAVGYERKIGGGKLWIVYVPDEGNESALGPNNNGGNNGVNASGDYSLGYMFKGKGYEWFIATAKDADIDNNTTDPLNTNYTFTALKVGGKYKSGPHVLKLQYETTTEEGAAGDQDGTLIFLGYEMKMGKNTFVAQYSTGTVERSGSPDQDNTYLAVGVVHKFNKKTRLWVGYSDMSVDNMNNVAGNNNGRSAFSVGMRIDF